MRYAGAKRGCVTRQRPVLALLDLGEPLIGFERIAAGRDEIHHRVEIRPREPA
jgi:hypothetical protein